MKTLKILTIGILGACTLLSCGDDDEGITGDDLRVNLYASSNTSGSITAYRFEQDGDTEVRTLGTVSTDGEGLYVDSDENEITQVSRNLNRINTYDELRNTDNGDNLDLVASSEMDLSSGRDIAVSGNFYVVADNADVDGDTSTAEGRFFVYQRDGNIYTLRNVVTTNFAVWGIEFVGNDLFAVVDKTADIAQFENFIANFNTTTTSTPTKRITVEGIVRTHGIGFDDGTLILTDIGEASSNVAGFDTDGAFHIITDFRAKFSLVDNGGTLAVAGNQVRVAGSNTLLGNPVSVDYDEDSNTVYIAERANSGGRVLAFTNPNAGGNLSPNVNNILPGASSVYFSED